MGVLILCAGCYFGIHAEEPFQSFYEGGDRTGLGVRGEVLCQYTYVIHSSYLNTDGACSVFFFTTVTSCVTPYRPIETIQ